jgi:hypothetical protein
MRQPYRRSRLPRLLASTSRPRCSRSRMKSSSNPLLRLWVKLRRTQPEQMSSGLPLKADIARYSRHVSKVPTTEVANLIMATYSAPQILTPKTEHHTLARLKHRIAFRRLGRHPCQHDCFLRRYPKIPRRLQRAPDIGIFRAAIESNQLHTVRALNLIAVAESLRPLAERLAAVGTQNLYPIGHEILPQ